MSLVFVYGTLKGMKDRFGPGSKFQSSAFVGHATTIDEFNLIDGDYPIAIHADDVKARVSHNGRIFGEVYAVQPDTVVALDTYEGYPTFYTRAQYQVNLLKGGCVSAWLYTGRNANAMIGTAGRGHMNPDDKGLLYWKFRDELPLTTPPG